MHMHELTAVNTLFEPTHESALCTFLQTKRQGIPEHSDIGEHVGAKVKVRYNGKLIPGTVVSTLGVGDEQEWVVRYADGHTHRYRRHDLEKVLVHTTKEKIGRQLDYVLVSTRWKSCVTDCKPRWGPAIHRDLHGEKNDHALVECTWSWRIRTVKPRTRKDFDCLYTQERDKRGNLKQTGCMAQFEKAVDRKLVELNYDASADSATIMYEKMCGAIHFAIDTILPVRRRSSCVCRKVSEKTKELYKRRSALCKKGTHEQFAQVQKEIKESGLADFENWVREWAEVIGDADRVGDTRGIYKGVKALAQKQCKPPHQPQYRQQRQHVAERRGRGSNVVPIP